MTRRKRLQSRSTKSVIDNKLTKGSGSVIQSKVTGNVFLGKPTSQSILIGPTNSLKNASASQSNHLATSVNIPSSNKHVANDVAGGNPPVRRNTIATKVTADVSAPNQIGVSNLKTNDVRPQSPPPSSNADPNPVHSSNNNNASNSTPESSPSVSITNNNEVHSPPNNPPVKETPHSPPIVSTDSVIGLPQYTAPPLTDAPAFSAIIQEVSKLKTSIDKLPQLVADAEYEMAIILAQVVSYIFKQLIADHVFAPLRPNLLVMNVMTPAVLSDMKQAILKSIPAVQEKFSEFAISISKEDSQEELNVTWGIMRSVKYALDMTNIDFYAIRLLLESEQ